MDGRREGEGGRERKGGVEEGKVVKGVTQEGRLEQMREGERSAVLGRERVGKGVRSGPRKKI